MQDPKDHQDPPHVPRNPAPPQQATDALALLRAEREAQQLAQLRAARAALLAGAAGPAPASIPGGLSGRVLEAHRATVPAMPAAPIGADLADLQRRASAIARGGAAVSAAPSLGAVLDTANRKRRLVLHPKIHARDLPADLPWEREGGRFLSAARRIANGRSKGDPLATTTMQVAAALDSHERRNRRHGARLTLDMLARAAMCCRETARKVIGQLEAGRLLDVVNVMVRRTIGGVLRLVRDANLYLPVQLRPDRPAAPRQRAQDGAAEHGQGFDDASDAAAAWAPLFGLALRPGWLNRRPLRE